MILTQLPKVVQRRIYTEFLFNDFLYHFRRFFSIKNVELGRKNAFYNWDHPSYELAMLQIMMNLRPIHFQRREEIMAELDEV
jgi:hypothetical protein